MKKYLVFTVFGVVLQMMAGSVCAQSQRDQAVSEFVKGNFAYKDGRYDEANAAYKNIVQAGFESGSVYYNLANSYFKQGALGRAILNYERAQRLMPRDNDLRANYRYALSLTKDPQRLRPQTFWPRIIDQHITFYTLGEISIILLVILILMAAVHLLSLYFYWPKTRTVLSLSLLAVCFVIYLGGFLIKWQEQSGLSIAVSATEARFEPRKEATAHFELYEGAQVRAVKREGDWMKVQRLDGKEGWVPQKNIEEI